MKKFITIAIIGVVILLVTIMVVVLNNGNKQPQPATALPSPTPTPVAATVMFRNMDVATATDNDVARVMGTPARSSAYLGITTLIYPSSIQGRNISVEINPDKSVKRIIEPLSETQKFSIMAADLGKEDIVLYGKHEELGFRLYVYVNKGVAVLANPTTDVVREKWYFPITNSAGFQSTIGEGFSTTHVEIKP
jgi:hypothetical protein